MTGALLALVVVIPLLAMCLYVRACTKRAMKFYNRNDREKMKC